MWENKLMRRLAIVSSILIVAGLSVAGLLFINKVDAQQGAALPVPESKSTMLNTVSTDNASATPVNTVVIDNWSLSCRDIAGEVDKKQCSAVNRIADKKTEQVLFVWLVGKNTEQKLVSSFQTPTGVLIAPGVDLELNDQRVRKINFVACDDRRCDANILMDEKFIDDVKITKQASAKIVSVTGHNILFKINTKGIQEVITAIIQ